MSTKLTSRENAQTSSTDKDLMGFASREDRKNWKYNEIHTLRIPLIISIYYTDCCLDCSMLAENNSLLCV